LGYSINDKLNFGKHSFDLQVEAVGNKVIGEIISNGKVLKKVVKEIDGDNEKEAVSEVFAQLKELLLSRIKERAKKQAVSLRDKLSEFFEVEEEQVKGFLLVVPSLKEPVKCSKGEMTSNLEDWLSALEKDYFSRFSISPEVISLHLKRNNEDVWVLLVWIKEEDTKVVFAVSNVKLSLVRRKLKADNLKQIVESILQSL